MVNESVKNADPIQETAEARRLAERYRCEFVDLKTAKIDYE